MVLTFAVVDSLLILSVVSNQLSVCVVFGGRAKRVCCRPSDGCSGSYICDRVSADCVNESGVG